MSCFERHSTSRDARWNDTIDYGPTASIAATGRAGVADAGQARTRLIRQTAGGPRMPSDMQSTRSPMMRNPRTLRNLATAFGVSAGVVAANPWHASPTVSLACAGLLLLIAIGLFCNAG